MAQKSSQSVYLSSRRLPTLVSSTEFPGCWGRLVQVGPAQAQLLKLTDRPLPLVEFLPRLLPLWLVAAVFDARWLKIKAARSSFLGAVLWSIAASQSLPLAD